MPAQDQIEDLVHALPPGRQILEIAPQRGGHHAVQAEPGVLGVADDAARQPPVEFVRGLGLAAPEGAIDPQQHAAQTAPPPPARTSPVS